MTIALMASLSVANATTYYVDSVNGNDTFTGTTTSTAWKTTYNPNNGWPKGTAFKPGDQILFKCGDVWGNATNTVPPAAGGGQQLVCQYSGSSGNPIIYGSYGTGASPIIYAAGLYPQAIFLKGSISYVTVENLTVENYDGTNIFDYAEGNRSGIQVGQYPDVMSNIIIQNNTIEDVEGYSNAPTSAHIRGLTASGTTNMCQYSCAALYVHGSQVNNLTLNNNYISECTGTGIYVQPNNGKTGCQALLVENNTVKNVGDDGISVIGAVSPVIEFNTCIDAGNNDPNAYSSWPATNPTLFTGSGPYLGEYGLAACGIWAGSASDTLFQYNYCAGTGLITYDGQAWDFDMNLTGTCVYQYNYSRQNQGGFMLSTQTGPSGTLTMIARNNISVDDGWYQKGGECFFNKYVDLYANNVFYQTNVTLSSVTYVAQGFMLPPGSGTLLGTWENNIFDTTCTVTTDNNYATSGRVFANNCYYDHTPVNPGTSAVQANPQYLNEAAAIMGTAWADETGFQLAASSPCVSTGTIVANNGGLDYAGNPITSTFKDIGAFLWQTQDIGTVGVAGSSSYVSGVFTVEGTGIDIWGTSDEFHYVDQHWTGDCITISRVTGITSTADSNAKGGIMYRDSTAANSMFVMLDTKPAGGLEFMDRASTGGNATESTAATGVTPSPTTPIWLKLVRSGSTYTAFYSTSVSTPTTWTQIGGNVSVSFANSTYLDGLIACSHNNSNLIVVVEDNVSIAP